MVVERMNRTQAELAIRFKLLEFLPKTEVSAREFVPVPGGFSPPVQGYAVHEGESTPHCEVGQSRGPFL